jgi:hypothetical protein
MSIPATGWAVEQGCQHKLPTFARMLLVVLADIFGRTGRLCPSIPYLAKRTGLSERTIRNLVPLLINLGLIAVTKSVGSVTHYQLLRSDLHADTPASLAAVSSDKLSPAPARPAGVNGAHPGKPGTEPRQVLPTTPASLAAEPLSEPRREPKTRARASETAEAAASQRAEAALSAAPSRLGIEAAPTPPEAAHEPPAFRRGPTTIAAVLRGISATPPDSETEPYIPIRRGPVDAIRTPEEQMAQLLGISLAEASQRMGSATLGASP